MCPCLFDFCIAWYPSTSLCVVGSDRCVSGLHQFVDWPTGWRNSAPGTHEIAQPTAFWSFISEPLFCFVLFLLEEYGFILEYVENNILAANNSIDLIIYVKLFHFGGCFVFVLKI